MGAKGDSALFEGTRGKSQGSLDLGGGGEGAAPKPTYSPSPKHEPGHNWGSENPIRSQEEGQRLLETGYSNGKQIFNVTDDGTIIKFQPDGTPENGYHAYPISSPSEIPTSILRQMVQDGKISRHRYNQILGGQL
ncbi:MAG: hypothetical protein K5859_06465 [Atopobiaceae bacterium]|nr:hypothetical protein [Atopobiaceae bacterium]